MKKLQSYSIKIHIAAIVCFLLPFFYTGCENDLRSSKNVDSVTTRNITEDTLAKTDNVINTEAQAFDSSVVNAPTPDTLSKEKETNSDDIALTLSEKNRWLAPLLVPKRETYTGVAMLLNALQYFVIYSIVIAFLFLLVSLFAKFIEPEARRLIVLMEVIALLSLLFARPISLVAESLLGFWISLILMLALVVVDGLRLRSKI